MSTCTADVPVIGVATEHVSLHAFCGNKLSGPPAARLALPALQPQQEQSSWHHLLITVVTSNACSMHTVDLGGQGARTSPQAADVVPAA
jgi:hypothetical protein